MLLHSLYTAHGYASLHHIALFFPLRNYPFLSWALFPFCVCMACFLFLNWHSLVHVQYLSTIQTSALLVFPLSFDLLNTTSNIPELLSLAWTSLSHHPTIEWMLLWNLEPSASVSTLKLLVQSSLHLFSPGPSIIVGWAWQMSGGG